MKRILLSPPDIGPLEIQYVVEAMESGWIAPLGPFVDRFEDEIRNFTGTKYAVALSSGSAALQLGMTASGLNRKDEVVVPTLTFAATAFSVIHAGGVPVFLDSEDQSWNLDPNLLEDFLSLRAKSGNLPKMVLAVDLFGQTANYSELSDICSRFEVMLASDSAESLGSFNLGVPSGRQGVFGAFSFNGNKIMTTSGGGAFVTDDESLASQVRYLSTQARQPYPWYEHTDIGFNFRLSNILAAIGCAQISRLEEMIAKRKLLRDMYSNAFQSLGVNVIKDAPWTTSNSWLTIAEFSDQQIALDVFNSCIDQQIEVRHVWKPMHMQPVFSSSEYYGGNKAEKFFQKSLCLPSGSSLQKEEIDRVIEQIAVTVLK